MIDKCGTCGDHYKHPRDAVRSESMNGWTFTRTFWSFLLPHRVIVECRECVFVSRTKYANGLCRWHSAQWMLDAATTDHNAKHVRELAWRFAGIYKFDRSVPSWELRWLSAVQNAALVDASLAAIGVRQWTFDAVKSSIVADGKSYDAYEVGKRLWSDTPGHEVGSTIRAYFANGGRFPDPEAITVAHGESSDGES